MAVPSALTKPPSVAEVVEEEEAASVEVVAEGTPEVEAIPAVVEDTMVEVGTAGGEEATVSLLLPVGSWNIS